MFVAWANPDEPATSAEPAIATDARRASISVAGTMLTWDAANDWRIPVADIPDAAWPLLPMVGGLSLVDDSGEPVGDGSLPAAKPEVTP